MSDLVKNLRNWSSLHRGQYSSELTTQSADLIEQQQARITELEAKTSCCMGVGNGNGRLFVYGDHESIKTAQRYVLERDELAATVERLREQLSAMAAQHQCGCGHPACTRCRDDADNQEVLRATPEQNLNAVKRDAFIEGFMFSGQGFNGELYNDGWPKVVELFDTELQIKYQSGEE